MSALEMWPRHNVPVPVGRELHVVASEAPFRQGPLVAQRRAARARMHRRRRRTLAILAIAASLAVLIFPGHAFGGTNASGVSSDQLGAGALTPGSIYVVESGDTLTSIARLVNPWNPRQAQEVLTHELKSSVVVVGEHIEIP